MINRLSYASPLYNRNKIGYKASEHPITDKAIKHAESEEVINMIKLTVKKNATWEEIDKAVDNFNITKLKPKDIEGLNLALKAEQEGEWHITKERGIRKLVIGYIDGKLRDS